MSFRRIVFWSHLSVGVTAGLIIFLLSITGVLLTYERQILGMAEARLSPASMSGEQMTADELALMAGEIAGQARLSLSTTAIRPAQSSSMPVADAQR